MFLAGTLAVIAAKRPGTTPARAATDATAAADRDAAPEAAPSLDKLCRRVHTARAEVLSLRRGPANSTPLVCARHSLLIAVEDYVTMLHALQMPIPPALQQELLLYRRLHY